MKAAGKPRDVNCVKREIPGLADYDAIKQSDITFLFLY